MDQFRSSLREFAVKHRDEIRKDPIFRMHFQVRVSPRTTLPSRSFIRASQSFQTTLQTVI